MHAKKRREPLGPSGSADTESTEGSYVTASRDVQMGGLYRLLVETVRDYAIFALDPQGYILSWNAGAQRFKGYKADEIIGKHFSIFYPRELVAEGFPEFELRTAANTGRFEDEGWRIRKDGTRFWANVVITALYNDAGELVGFGKVTRDLSERREAEEALRESEQRFRLLVDGVRDYAIYMLDPEGRVTTWNEGAQRIKGFEAREIIGKHFSRFFPKEDVAAGKPARELQIAGEKGRYEEEGVRVRKDGTRFWANVVITALHNNSGELVGFAKVTRDLTERRAAEQRALDAARDVAATQAARKAAEEREQELQVLNDQLKRQAIELKLRTQEAEEARRLAEDARARADEANRVKSQFLAAMSHELRTPLNAIGGFADLLAMGLSGPVVPEQVEQLSRIKRSQTHLLGIINDILNFARAEGGHLKYDMGPVVVADVLSRVNDVMAPQAARSGLRLEKVDCEPDLIAWGDAPKIEQIVLNIVSNALKFTEPGGVVSVSCRREEAGEIVLTIRDDGVGIAPENLETIFEPFVQVGRSLTHGPEGTGLGLAISRDMTRAMGGDIRVRSTLGRGSEFEVMLPAAPEG